MPEPKRKRSRARRDKRFANKGMKVKSFGACSQCEAPNLPHQICQQCGYYKGRKVLSTKLDRSLKRGERKVVAKSSQAAPEAPSQA